MKVSELEKRINLLDLISEDYNIKNISNGIYRVNPCPVCNHNDHFTVYTDSNSFMSFADCCKGGSVYKYLMEVKNMNEDMAYEKLKILANIKENTSLKTITPRIQENYNDYTSFILNAYEIQSKHDRSFFYDRGLNDEIIEKYKLCITDINGEKRALFPVWIDEKVITYNARIVKISGQTPKYKKPQGKFTPFNAQILKNNTVTPTILCEGEMDSLTLETIGINSVGLGGLQNYTKIAEMVEKSPNFILTAFDNDKPGKEATEKIGLPSIEIPQEFKDINEWYLADSQGFKISINQQIQNLRKPDSMASYLDNGFAADINSFCKNRQRKTGFDNLDKQLKGLHAGLYVIGGISSVGKTTFAHQMADQIAEQGEHVLYFSLEQSKFELVCKSLARQTKISSFASEGVSSFKIKSGYSSTSVLSSIKEYKKVAECINIIEGNFNTTAENIQKATAQYIKTNGVNPVVFIDYLQIVQGDSKLNDKQRIDQTTTTLKRMSRDLDLTVFVISSLNRGNYLAPIDFESFKESGGIEYTADVVFGLQLKVLNDDLFSKAMKITEKREKLNQAKKASPREIELVCLKNRMGIPYFKCEYSYQPKFDCFMELISKKDKKVAGNVR